MNSQEWDRRFTLVELEQAQRLINRAGARWDGATGGDPELDMYLSNAEQEIESAISHVYRCLDE